MLRGMFALIIYDTSDKAYYAIRDHVGINPLYIGYGADGSVWFASEMKALNSSCARFEVFPPGHFYSSKTGTFTRWYAPDWMEPSYLAPSDSYNPARLRRSFEQAVKRHMMSDVPWGVLLSGGLDSSLVAAVAARIMRGVAGGRGIGGGGGDGKSESTTKGMSTKAEEVLAPPVHGGWFPRLHSYCVGLEGSPDLQAAARVAAFLGTVHHAYTFTVQEGLDALSEVIYHLETFDCTTLRAATPMFLMSRKIKAMGVKMVLSGEGADEIFAGYLYFHKAPNPQELQAELRDKVARLHLFDCLRANKATAAWGVEARVPFLDADFLDAAMRIDPALKMITPSQSAQGQGQESRRPCIEKHVLRLAFDTPEDPYLPPDILWRQKEQFSDGVGYGWIDALREHADRCVSDQMFSNAANRFPENTPASKEAYHYRALFEAHFPQVDAARTVPGGPSIACSTARALDWDTSFKLR